jgi:GTP-binding protein
MEQQTALTQDRPPMTFGTAIEGLRNIAIIAHIDHGKTTMVDKLLKETHSIPDHRDLGECILDSNDLERERGITILAKNISIPYRGIKINIIDTPGHADFGGEVERTVQMADGVLLLVDASEGPMPQTRFVIKKAFHRLLQPIVVINKVDRPDARVEEVVEEVGDLFLELIEELGLDGKTTTAGKDFLDFPVIYASGRDGWAGLTPDDRGRGMVPLLDTILKEIPPPRGNPHAPLQMQVTTLDYSEFVGRIGIGRVYAGELRAGDRVLVSGRRGDRLVTIKELYLFDKLGRSRAERAGTGDICAVTGVEDVEIGDTLTDPESPAPMPLIEVDRPTISMVFCINDSPLAGQDGEFLTSRHLRARLFKELESNIALRVEESSDAGVFEVSGRGTLHLGILIENMRREGYEFQVGKPRVIYIEENGQRLEPIELLVCQVPEEFAGRVIEALGGRRAEMCRFEPQGSRVNLEFKIPSRGLIGMGSRLMNLTQGEAIVYHSFHAYEPFKGEIPRRQSGVMVSHETGTAVAYSLFNLKDRGPMFVEPGTAVYEGMIVGEHCKDNDIVVNVCKEKKLTNIRAAGSDKNIILSPPRRMSIEEALEYIDDDELVEITPKTFRLRKRLLSEKDRRKASRAEA